MDRYIRPIAIQALNEVSREYLEPKLPSFGYPGIVKALVGGAIMFLSDKYLGANKDIGIFLGAGMVARGVMELVSSFVAPKPTVVITPTAVRPAPAVKIA